MLYPGGSQVDVNSKGFSWINNYWCNLLNENAISGQHNPGRPIALTGMAVLCTSLSYFWYVMPKHMHLKKLHRLIIQVPGILSMIISIFLFTGFHDAIINAAGILGLIALIGTFISLYKLKWFWLFSVGIFNMMLVVLNNYIYYSKGLIIYLPVIQKISFVFFLFWICRINIKVYKKVQSTHQKKLKIDY